MANFNTNKIIYSWHSFMKRVYLAMASGFCLSQTNKELSLTLCFICR